MAVSPHLRVFVLVSFPGNHYPQPVGHVPDPLQPRRRNRIQQREAGRQPRRRLSTVRNSTISVKEAASRGQPRERTLLHIALFSFTSIRTSEVPIICCANFLISFTAFGARFLNWTLNRRLCRLIVYSRTTTSLDRFLSTICG